jgi:hypothetical protein
MSVDENAEGEAGAILRLSDLDEWEFYRVARNGDAAYILALRPYVELREVEYEVWDDRGEEPRFSGSVGCEDVGERWPDVARQPLVERIVRTIASEA